MASLDPSLCSIALIILLLVLVYTFPSHHVGKVLSKILSPLATWQSHIASKEKSQNGSSLQTSPEPDKAPKVSRDWWTDEKQFQLERRAIFSKSWLFTAHTSKFQKPGDYRTFDIAGFSILLILGKDSQIRAFHNVCRHRAYAVTKKDCGSSLVLGCRYHGWSYNTKGELIKAPEFDQVPNFDKSMNGLWELKIGIKEDMIFVNLDAGDAKNFALGDAEAVLKKWKVHGMKDVAHWKVEGAFNWKLGVGELANTKQVGKGYSWRSRFPVEQQEDLFIPPNTVIRSMTTGVLLALRLLPKSAKSTMVECCVFARKFHDKSTDGFKADVQLQVKRLEELQSMATWGEIFSSDLIHKGDFDRILKKHQDSEERFRGEIHPAAQKQNVTQAGKDDEDFCQELENAASICYAKANGLLDW